MNQSFLGCAVFSANVVAVALIIGILTLAGAPRYFVVGVALVSWIIGGTSYAALRGSGS